MKIHHSYFRNNIETKTNFEKIITSQLDKRNRRVLRWEKLQTTDVAFRSVVRNLRPYGSIRPLMKKLCGRAHVMAAVKFLWLLHEDTQ